MIDKYLKNIFKTTQMGDAREESYYSDLKALLEEYIEKIGKQYSVTTLPRNTDGGNPDFRVWDGKSKIVGYIEAKSPGTDISKVEESGQLKRYRKTFPNLILTNFLEFKLYRNGEFKKEVAIGDFSAIERFNMSPPAKDEEEFFDLLDHFFSFSIPKSTTAKQLAIELAKRTRFLRDAVIQQELVDEQTEGMQTLEQFYSAFKNHLIFSLDIQEFSDLFAQTITYGLFAARSRADDGFTRETAYKYIPHTVGILRDVFRFISSADLPKQMEWIIDDIVEVLATSNVNKIMHDFYSEGKGRDPVIHFYETFLAEYDPKEREKRGVYYTPEPVVSYITRSVHQLLKDKFSKEDGFATPSVTVLDPAAGTLTFPAFAIEQAVQEYKSKYGEGGIASLIKDHILENFYAFELMMASYAIGHLKIGFILEEHNYHLPDNERFKLYLTNTLDLSKENLSQLPGFFEHTLAEESREALKVKEETPIMVIIGNPPYSGISENKGEWILKQIEEYKKVDGKPLGERKHWLQDDYVKFFRFAQWKIDQAGQGVLGFITNHAWLDNPTFRGMRASLLDTFDEIYIVNLHGNSLKKETTPKGEKDENVFDIRTGVAITIGVKLSKPAAQKKVFYADQWGLREEKYDWLEKNSAQSTKWQMLRPNTPYYLFIPQTVEGQKEYQRFTKITDIFPVNSTGILTGRDKFVIDLDKHSLEDRILHFRNPSEPDEIIKEAYQLKDKPAYKWFVSEARKQLQNFLNWKENFMKILYRPFDERWVYYHPSVVFWPRSNIMRHMLRPNLALISTRFVFRKEQGFSHAFVTENILDINQLQSPGTAQLFPLYLYDNENQGQQDIFQGSEKTGKREPNINPEILAKLKSAFGKKPTPEEIFYYIYAIFYSNIYRQKYKEFLTIDFPRIPFVKDYNLFKDLSARGNKLVDLHLLKSKALDKSTTKFYGAHSDYIKNVTYDKKLKRVNINDSQYFEGIAPEVWNYYIGGYQVLNKWLKDRRGRMLLSEDIKHYIKIVAALEQTIKIQKEIDAPYMSIEENLI